MDAKSQAKNRPFRHVVIPRYTNFRLKDTEAGISIQELYDRLIADESRNDQIFDDLLKALDQGRSPILLTDRTSHLEYFENRERMLLSERKKQVTGHENEPDILLHESVRKQARKLKMLEYLLDSGKQEEFNLLFNEFVRTCSLLSINHPLFLELYFGISTLFLSQLNRRDNKDHPGELEKTILMLLRPELEGTSQKAMEGLRQLASTFFVRSKGKMEERTLLVIRKIQQFIDDHPEDDLSLTHLGELVYLNPTYLSNLYKQTTGNSLSEYISAARLNKAKELLEDDKFKIHEIAGRVGFENPGYFARFFKKLMNVTPQEYRDSCLRTSLEKTTEHSNRSHREKNTNL